MRALQAVLRQALWDSPDVQALQLPGLYPALGLLPLATQYLRSACVDAADTTCSWPADQWQCRGAQDCTETVALQYTSGEMSGVSGWFSDKLMEAVDPEV